MVDVFVIGGGPGGYVAAIKASQLGLSVALAEEADMGGTCTNWGCIPTKTMLASSKLFTRMQEARKFGLTAESVGADFGAIMTRKDQVVVRLRKGIEYLMKKNHVQVYASRATLRDATHVCVDATGEVVEAKNVIIATGSSPIKFPPFTDPGIWTSDDVFRNREQPKELVVIGGGVIGVEMATFFSAIGTKVTIVELMPHILPIEDEDVALALAATLKKRGITIIAGAKTQSVTPTEAGYTLILDVDGATQEIHGDHVLLSIGRRSNVGPELEPLGVTLSKKGIVVDDHMRTSVPGVYAVGDVKGTYMLAHVAEKRRSRRCREHRRARRSHGLYRRPFRRVHRPGDQRRGQERIRAQGRRSPLQGGDIPCQRQRQGADDGGKHRFCQGPGTCRNP